LSLANLGVKTHDGVVLKYLIIGAIILAVIFIMARRSSRRPKEPVAPQRPKMISADGGAVAAEIDGQEFDIDPAILAEIRALARSGRKLEAIQRLRDATDLDLARAKDIVDSLERMPQR
jgi:ribosomal protein L7/L12